MAHLHAISKNESHECVLKEEKQEMETCVCVHACVLGTCALCNILGIFNAKTHVRVSFIMFPANYRNKCATADTN